MRKKVTRVMLYLLLFILLIIALDIDVWFLTWARVYLHRIVSAIHWCALGIMNAFFVTPK